jgi:hypothetical protein
MRAAAHSANCSIAVTGHEPWYCRFAKVMEKERLIAAAGSQPLSSDCNL